MNTTRRQCYLSPPQPSIANLNRSIANRPTNRLKPQSPPATSTRPSLTLSIACRWPLPTRHNPINRDFDGLPLNLRLLSKLQTLTHTSLKSSPILRRPSHRRRLLKQASIAPSSSHLLSRDRRRPLATLGGCTRFHEQVENLVLDVLLANLMKHITSTKDLVEIVVDQVFSDDTLCLSEICRVLTLGLQSSECIAWAKALQSDHVLTRILWIAENTLNPILIEKSATNRPTMSLVVHMLSGQSFNLPVPSEPAYILMSSNPAAGADNIELNKSDGSHRNALQATNNRFVKIGGQLAKTGITNCYRLQILQEVCELFSNS